MQHRHAIVVQDLATWLQSYPCRTETSQETVISSREFLEPEEDSKVECTDKSPHRSETDGIAEMALRSDQEGTSTVLVQSGLKEQWWSDAMECCGNCAAFRICWLMGKLCTSEDSANMSQDLSYPFKQQLSIIQLLRKTKRGFINSARKAAQPSLWDVRLLLRAERQRRTVVGDAEESQENHAPKVCAKEGDEFISHARME